MERWANKIAVVTGASSGIGKTIAKSLVTAGLNVVGLARRDDQLALLSEELKGSKGSFEYLHCDVSKEEDIRKCFEVIEKKFGGVDVLVNNAGIARNETIGEGTTKSVREIFDVNLLAPIIISREALKSMRQRKTEGHIININSIMGLHVCSFIPTSVYAPSKFGLRAVADTLRHEIIATKDNIRVTSIYPGLAKTEIAEMSGHNDAKIYDQYPYMQTQPIANCVLHVLSAPEGVEVREMVITPLHGIL